MMTPTKDNRYYIIYRIFSYDLAKQFAGLNKIFIYNVNAVAVIVAV